MNNEKFYCPQCVVETTSHCNNCNTTYSPEELIPESKTRLKDGIRIIERRGGARKGSGPKPSEEEKSQLSVFVSTETLKSLKEISEITSISQAKLVEMCLRNWAESYNLERSKEKGEIVPTISTKIHLKKELFDQLCDESVLKKEDYLQTIERILSQYFVK